jgi:hypothetical protein
MFQSWELQENEWITLGVQHLVIYSISSVQRNALDHLIWQMELNALYIFW